MDLLLLYLKPCESVINISLGMLSGRLMEANESSSACPMRAIVSISLGGFHLKLKRGRGLFGRQEF